VRAGFLVAIAALGAVPGPVHAAAAASPVRSFATGKLTIGGETFAPADIVDARALPDINKKVGLMVSFNEAAAARLQTITAALVGKPMLIALDGRTLAAELIRKPIGGGVIEIPGRWSLEEAEMLARRISGRDPLPDDLGGE